MLNQYTNDIKKTIPEGFALKQENKYRLIISYKRTGMGCMNFFLIIWLSIWTFICVILLLQFFGLEVIAHGKPVPLCVVLVHWGGELFVAFYLIYLLFCRKIFRLDDRKLIIETNILKYKQIKIIQKVSIRKFIQIKDGGEDEDSFPSWGVKAETDTEKITLIRRQPYKKSLWLGQILAKWANVPFVRA